MFIFDMIFERFLLMVLMKLVMVFCGLMFRLGVMFVRVFRVSQGCIVLVLQLVSMVKWWILCVLLVLIISLVVVCRLIFIRCWWMVDSVSSVGMVICLWFMWWLVRIRMLQFVWMVFFVLVCKQVMCVLMFFLFQLVGQVMLILQLWNLLLVCFFMLCSCVMLLKFSIGWEIFRWIGGFIVLMLSRFGCGLMNDISDMMIVLWIGLMGGLVICVNSWWKQLYSGLLCLESMVRGVLLFIELMFFLLVVVMGVSRNLMFFWVKLKVCWW